MTNDPNIFTKIIQGSKGKEKTKDIIIVNLDLMPFTNAFERLVNGREDITIYRFRYNRLAHAR